MWRLEVTEPLFLLMIEATNDSFQLPEKGLVGNHAIFDAAMIDTPKIDEAFKAQYSEQQSRVQVKRHDQVSHIT